jgi:hypothetical protein
MIPHMESSPTVSSDKRIIEFITPVPIYPEGKSRLGNLEEEDDVKLP